MYKNFETYINMAYDDLNVGGIHECFGWIKRTPEETFLYNLGKINVPKHFTFSSYILWDQLSIWHNKYKIKEIQ